MQLLSRCKRSIDRSLAAESNYDAVKAILNGYNSTNCQTKKYISSNFHHLSPLFEFKVMNIKLQGFLHYFSFDLFLILISPHLLFASSRLTFSVNPFSVINGVMKVKQREYQREGASWGEVPVPNQSIREFERWNMSNDIRFLTTENWSYSY